MTLALDNHYETLMENNRWDGNNSVKKIQMELKQKSKNKGRVAWKQANFKKVILYGKVSDSDVDRSV